MSQVEGLIVGEKLIEGKTKIVYELPSEPGNCLLVSKDKITAFNAARAHDLEGKAAISNKTNQLIYSFLNKIGVKTHFVRPNTESSFVARNCHMILIEWVTRRVATGSFLRRNPGVPEGYRFSPPKVEYFYKDDAQDDPQWTYEQIVSSQMQPGGPKTPVLTADDVDVLTKTTRTVFEVLERAWASLDCQLVDMKIEFGIDSETGEILLADVIDSDSWRLWPGGDKRLMRDKQVYRNLTEVTPESLETVKRNFAWVADQLDRFLPPSIGRVVIVAGSPSDAAFCAKIGQSLSDLGIQWVQRFTSAHKTTEDALAILAEYEGTAFSQPTVIIAVAGRSNGLGPVMSGNSCLPVINCPPMEPASPFTPLDVWSSLRLPSGLGCPTLLYPEAAALAAGQILALRDHVIWGSLRVRQLQAIVKTKRADAQARAPHLPNHCGDN